MKQIKEWTQYYVELLVKLGLVRFSLLLACIIIVFAFVMQLAIHSIIIGSIKYDEIKSSIIFSLIFTPVSVYFLSIVVEQLVESRKNLRGLVRELEEARASDLKLNNQLTENIEKLNKEIVVRKNAEQAHFEAMRILENEVASKEKAQQELADQTQLLRLFINASPDLIYYRNEKGQFSGCNTAMEELTGKTSDELVGLTPWQVYSADIASEIVKTDQQVLATNQEITYEQWFEYQNGRKANFEMRKVPFYSYTGERLGLMGFGREITERKKYQEALEKASRDKTTFISTISHELRTPLNGIVGLSQILLDSPLNENQLDSLRTIYVSAVTLGNIFNDIIDLDKSDRSRLALSLLPINLNEFVGDISNIGKLMAEQKGLKFNFDLLTPLPNYINADATRLRQILWNLIANAIKFTKEGSVNISLSAEIKDNIVDLQFDVEDSGIGISDIEQENIFAMYYQIKQEDNNLHAVGTGIGLAVSRNLARLMNGDINVDSELGFGSTFSFYFNAEVVEISESEDHLALPSCHILLVEDIELNITVATSLLEKLGHSLVVARNGKEAIELYKEDKFDFLLLDINLPDMTGFDIANKLREKYQTLPPLIALTANVISNKQEYLAKGMDDAISKPITLKNLTQSLQRFHMSAKSIDSLHNANSSEFLPHKKIVKSHGFTDTDLDVLDIEMLKSYIDIAGIEAITNSLNIFQQIMPEYVEILEQGLINKNQDLIVDEAHKMKGAAASIGLKRIQKIAQMAQSPELENWWDDIAIWIEEIKEHYQDDVGLLALWLKDQKMKETKPNSRQEAEYMI